MAEKVLDVALPLPLQAAFSYRLPPGLPRPERGARVLVPFGSRRVMGVVLGDSLSAHSPDERTLKDILQVFETQPLVATALLDLAAWVSEYYLAPPGECYRLLFPPDGLSASRAIVRTGSAGADVGSAASVTRGTGFRYALRAERTATAYRPRGRAQAALLEQLDAKGGACLVRDLVADHASRRAALKRLVDEGAVQLVQERVSRRPEGLRVVDREAPVLTHEQRAVLDPIEHALEEGRYEPFLLHGVTGSGKTEVYLRAAASTLDRGRGALFLVPEIALTPFLVRTAKGRFGERVSILHSELSKGERHDEWWRIRDGEARVVIGVRSAVFAPIGNLGLLVVDEEHEAAFKQEESPRYHARDVAIVRAGLEKAAVILGSATPSVESYANALKKKYHYLQLPNRIGASRLPHVEIVDRRAVLKARGDAVLTPVLREAIGKRLRDSDQVLLLLNRRGYATSLLCRECGQQASCPNCSVLLTLHQTGRTVQCHYCGYQLRTPVTCAACRGEYLRFSGYGTERVVEAVNAAFPEARVARLDRDSAVRRGAVRETLRAFEAGETDVLVGTQMIAKGHDFPRVTLVGVVDADIGLGLPDFRAAERSFQLLTQVAGRAGRGEREGEVILQSHWPDHYALRHACEQDYEAFFKTEIEFRRTMAYPPTAALLNLIVRANDAGHAEAEAQAVADRLRALAQRRFRVLGPARAPLARLRGEHRVQILLKGQRTAMRESVRDALRERYGTVRWPGISVDVDPLSVM